MEHLDRRPFADSAGNAYQFNLTGIAGISLLTNSSAYSYGVSPCGIPTSACVPAQHPVGWPYAAVTQFFVNSASSGNCYNAGTGAEQPCSDNCEPAAVGLPQWQLLDASNATAGLWASFSGMFLASGDQMTCSWDPVTGTTTPRTSAIVLQCNASLPRGTVVVDSVGEVRLWRWGARDGVGDGVGILLGDSVEAPGRRRLESRWLPLRSEPLVQLHRRDELRGRVPPEAGAAAAAAAPARPPPPHGPRLRPLRALPLPARPR